MKILRTIAPSPTVAVNTLALTKKAAGETVFNYAAGDPILPNHPAILAGAKKGMEQGMVPYPPLPGIPQLKKLTAAWMNKTYACHYTPQEVLVTCGGKFALFAALHALLEPGSEVLVCAPYWPSYPELVTLCNGVPKIIPSSAEKQWKVTPNELKQHATARTRVLLFNNANNPTGALYTHEEIGAILRVAQEKDFVVISDEVYSEICYDQSRFISCGMFPEHKERVAIVQSCSKNFGMTGWRVGFLLGPEALIKAAMSLQGQTTTGTSLVSQWAALAALEQPEEIARYVRKAMTERRQCLMQKFQELFQKPLPMPPSAIYAFIPLELLGAEGRDSLSFCERVLREANVALVPGSAFGQEGYVRLAFSDPCEILEKGLEALARVCRR